MKAGIFAGGWFISISWSAGLVVILAAGMLWPVHGRADGCFVAPPFVWNKYKDINEPTQKAIMIYDVGREDLILQVKYDGPVERFGWLVPVPNLPTVQMGSMECFYELSRYTQEHWKPRQFMLPTNVDLANVLQSLRGSGAGPKLEPVKVEEVKTVGAYEVAVLSAAEPGALEQWLTENGFSFPADKAGVIDDYVRKHWYFVVARVDLDRGEGLKIVDAPRQGGTKRQRKRVAEKLSSGELNPLWIRFASTQCVFPLKISAVNGTPSEVQVYVLSPEPLVERRMFAKKLEEVKKLALDQAAGRPHTSSGYAPVPYRPEPEFDRIFAGYMPPEWQTHYGAVAAGQFPACAGVAPEFKDKPWWLTKQTWIFQPEEMQDLIFERAAPVFLAAMSDEGGTYAEKLLEGFGDDAVPEIIEALQSTDLQTRLHALPLLNSEVGGNSQVLALLPALFHDADPRVRGAAAGTAYWHWRPEFVQPLIGLLEDENSSVRASAAYALQRSSVATVLLPVLSSGDMKAVEAAESILQKGGWPATKNEVAALMGNPHWEARLSAVDLLDDLGPDSGAEWIVPLLRDTNSTVQRQTWLYLKRVTGWDIPKDKPDDWRQWWADHRDLVAIKDFTAWLYSNPRNGGLYQRRGCLYYDTGNFEKAKADFQQACVLTSGDTDYSHFRLWLADARLNGPAAATPELAAYLNSRKTGKPGDWPSTVGSFLAGRMNEADFLAAAQNANPQTDREQHCEAWYYAGAKRVIAGDKDAAAEDFKKCLATGVDSFEEYDSAAAELKWLGTPAVAGHL